MTTDQAKAGSEIETVADEPTLAGAFSSEGVDVTMIRWMLKRSPTERLQAAQDLLNTVESAHRLDAD